MIKTVTIGDVSDAWLISHLDKDKVELPLTVDYTCVMAVIDLSDDTTVVSRSVTDTQDNNFLVYLTEAETATLTHRQRYKLVTELANPLLTPKPLKKEASTEFEAVNGCIA